MKTKRARQSFTSFVAWRYIRTGSRNKFFSWIATLSVAGIAIGIATMIVVISVINGFERELRDRFLNANAHILAFRYPDGLKNPETWKKTITDDFGKDVTGISPFVHYETMIKKDAIMQSVLVRGFDPAEREKVQSLKKTIEPLSALDDLSKEVQTYKQTKTLPDVPAIIIGVGLATIINAKIGDSVYLLSPQSNTATKDIKHFRVVGIYRSGLKHYDNKLTAMSLPMAQSFFQMGERVTGLEIGLVRPYDSPKIASRMLAKYSLSIKEWQSFNRPLLEALNMERAVIAAVVCLVSIVAGFNILTTLFVGVTLKQKEISILKALGASNRKIVSIFLKQGLFFGIFGSLLGSVLAFAICQALDRIQFIDLPDPYFLTNLPVDYDPRFYVLFSVTGIVIAVLSGVFPALTAARVVPSEGLRGTGKAF